MKSIEVDSISKNIKKYRLLNGMTQEKLATLLDLDTQYYAQLERGERNFTIEKIVKACDVFQIGIEDIIELPQRNDDCEDLKQSIISRVEKMNSRELKIIQKFIDSILLYIK